ncbi:MAG: substrate-binding domain-containing protein, partial [Clostridia bacterium]|nr:substrate-binding domain-containing protein [Clostridia bacterium]
MSVQDVRDHLLELDKKGVAFDAVLASEDSLAIGAMKYARAAGKRIPEEMSVVGYNNSNFCLFTEPELTSVDNKLKAICDHIVETMMGVLEGKEMPQKTVFTGEVVLRQSTRK